MSSTIAPAPNDKADRFQILRSAFLSFASLRCHYFCRRFQARQELHSVPAPAATPHAPWLWRLLRPSTLGQGGAPPCPKVYI